jgi:cytosine/adenosine deaminase-related metal-dependent hydrolase
MIGRTDDVDESGKEHSADMAEKTAIRGGDIIAHNGETHRLLRDGVLVYEGDTIIHVGKTYKGVVDKTINASGMLVIPGLVSTHSHLRGNEGYRMVIDGGRRDFMRSGFLNYCGNRPGGGPGFLATQDPVAAIRYALSASLRHGVTTIVELDSGLPDNGQSVVKLAGECGIRMYYSPSFTAGEYNFNEKGVLCHSWDEKRGLEGLERACEFIEKFDGSHDGRIHGMVVLNEFFSSTPELRKRTKRAAQKLGVGITTHFCEQLYEFHETVRKTGKTPVSVLEEEGFLGPEVILGHCKFVAGHSMTTYPWKGDLEAIAASGATVSHSPIAYSRRGSTFESFQRFLDHGITLSMGTDAHPHDVISEMQYAAIVCKIVEKDHLAANARDVFNAGTLGGAKAVMRDDLGKLSPGAKADIVLVDLDNLTIGPVLDPIRALIYTGTGDMVDTVIIGGHTVVKGRRLLVWDEAEVLKTVRASSKRVWDSFS